MSVVLSSKEPDNSIPVSRLIKGEVAVIVEWGTSPEYIGTVVQLVHSAKSPGFLQMLGKSDGWTNVDFLNESHRVRVLQPGETLTIQ